MASHPLRPIAFVLASTNHGTMIVNRNDGHMTDATHGYGVGLELLSASAFSPYDAELLTAILDRRRRHGGDGVVALDGGANIGTHTVEWARHMYGWGSVLAFEAQEVVFYSLAGNLAINNCFNARAQLCALGATLGELLVPQPNYLVPASYGSLELRQRPETEFIGQQISYDPAACRSVPMRTIDSLALSRLDLLKLDVEGMEAEVLRGATQTLGRLRPVVFVEVLKSDQDELVGLLKQAGYATFYAWRQNMLALHAQDATAADLSLVDGALHFI